MRRRRVCFVTGTRAEFGLMASVLAAIGAHPKLQLQLVVTGMHLSRAHGDGLAAIRRAGWKVDRVVPWRGNDRAAATGAAMAGLAKAFAELESDIVLVVGDRVEAFAAASAGAISGRIVAHVHGGDRALGQVDDSLRHAITKLAHVHFPATQASAERIVRMGEDAWRVHVVGSPGLDGIKEAAAGRDVIRAKYGAGPFALVVLHPTSADEGVESRRAKLLLREVRRVVPRVVIIGSNNDPGAEGIRRAWEAAKDVVYQADVPRGEFLGLMRDAAMLVGNSSAGIIEAASFGTPVVDVGDRQAGRQRGGNVAHAAFGAGKLKEAIEKAAAGGRVRGKSIYGAGRAGERIARVLAGVRREDRVVRKLIAY